MSIFANVMALAARLDAPMQHCASIEHRTVPKFSEQAPVSGEIESRR